MSARAGVGGDEAVVGANRVRPFSAMAVAAMRWREELLERLVGDGDALFDAGGFVEGPVDAEVDAALAVFFHRFGEAVEGARLERADGAAGIAVGAVVLIGD